MANQILYLLTKLGIFAYMDNGYLSNLATVKCYSITIHNAEYMNKFNSIIKLTGKKGTKQRQVEMKHRSNLSDVLSTVTMYKIKQLLKDNNIKGCRIQTKNNSITKSYLQKILPKIELQNKSVADSLQYLVSDSIVWDRIQSIEHIGVREVFDRSVEDSHNYIVNGLLVHNSGGLEQAADVIKFLYRDEYYYPETSPHKKIAELIIGKQREGACGTVKLFFEASTTSFSSLENGKPKEAS
jgi:intein/homing endonuclease